MERIRAVVAGAGGRMGQRIIVARRVRCCGATPARRRTLAVTRCTRVALTGIVTVPDARKAAAVKGAVEGPVDPRCPASILQTHGDCRLFLDRGAASLLRRRR